MTTKEDDWVNRLLTEIHSHSLSNVKNSDELTEKQLLVLKAISFGLTEVEAAEIIGISHEAAKDRMRECRRKLKAKTQAHAVANAIRAGIII